MPVSRVLPWGPPRNTNHHLSSLCHPLLKDLKWVEVMQHMTPPSIPYSSSFQLHRSLLSVLQSEEKMPLQHQRSSGFRFAIWSSPCSYYPHREIPAREVTLGCWWHPTQSKLKSKGTLTFLKWQLTLSPHVTARDNLWQMTTFNYVWLCHKYKSKLKSYLT